MHAEPHALILNWLLQSTVLSEKHGHCLLFMLAGYSHFCRVDIDCMWLQRSRFGFRISLVHFLVQIALRVVAKRLLRLHSLVRTLVLLSAIFVQKSSAFIRGEMRLPVIDGLAELRFVVHLLLRRKLLLDLTEHLLIVLLRLCIHLLHQLTVAPRSQLRLRCMTAKVPSCYLPRRVKTETRLVGTRRHC